MSNYIFDNAAPQAGQRFSSLETLYDPWTIRHLEATGIGSGWHCWEIGAGGGSIAAWLAERCGPGSHVLATDINPRFLKELAALDRPNVETRRHDIVVDPLPAQTFDLIHARLVLIHLPAREQVLERLMTALKPGGWLVLEEFDDTLLNRNYLATDVQAGALLQKMHTAQNQLMKARGADLTWGRKLYRALRAHGLINMGMEGYVAIGDGRSPLASLFQANCEQVREEAVKAGLITNEEVDQVITSLNDPNFTISSLIMFTAWGQRP